LGNDTQNRVLENPVSRAEAREAILPDRLIRDLIDDAIDDLGDVEGGQFLKVGRREARGILEDLVLNVWSVVKVIRA
jgi:hypothetical protein